MKEKFKELRAKREEKKLKKNLETNMKALRESEDGLQHSQTVEVKKSFKFGDIRKKIK